MAVLLTLINTCKPPNGIDDTNIGSSIPTKVNHKMVVAAVSD